MNMPPRYTSKHCFNGFPVKPTAFYDFPDCHSVRLHGSIFAHKVIRQFCIVILNALIVRVFVSFAKNMVRVQDIFGVRGPFQIVRVIVPEVAVKVIHFVSERVRLKKGPRDQDRHQKCSPRVASEIHLQIPTISGRIRLEDPFFCSTASEMAFYSTEVANAVASIKIVDCFPRLYFNNWIRHFRPFDSRLTCSGVRRGCNRTDAEIICATT